MFIRKIKEVVKSVNPYYNLKNEEYTRSVYFTITDMKLFDMENNKVNLDFWNPLSYVITGVYISDSGESYIEGVSSGSSFSEVHKKSIELGIECIDFEVIDIPSFSPWGDQQEFDYRVIYEDLPEWIECDNCESRYKSEYLGQDDYYDFDETLCPCCANKIYEYELR